MGGLRHEIIIEVEALRPQYLMDSSIWHRQSRKSIRDWVIVQFSFVPSRAVTSCIASVCSMSFCTGMCGLLQRLDCPCWRCLSTPSTCPVIAVFCSQPTLRLHFPTHRQLCLDLLHCHLDDASALPSSWSDRPSSYMLRLVRRPV